MEDNIESFASFASELDTYDSNNGQFTAYTPNLKKEVERLEKEEGMSEDEAVIYLKKNVDSFRDTYGKENFDRRKKAYSQIVTNYEAQYKAMTAEEQKKYMEDNIEYFSYMAALLDEYNSYNGQFTAFTSQLQKEVERLEKEKGISESDAILLVSKDIAAFRLEYGKESFDDNKKAYAQSIKNTNDKILSDPYMAYNITKQAMYYEIKNSPNGTASPALIAYASGYDDESYVDLQSNPQMYKEYINGFHEYIKGKTAEELGEKPFEDYKNAYKEKYIDKMCQRSYQYYSQNKDKKAVGEDMSLKDWRKDIEQEAENQYQLSTYRDPITGRRAYKAGLKGRETEDEAQLGNYKQALVGYYSAPSSARKEYLENAIYSHSEDFTPEQLQKFDNITNDPKYEEALSLLGFNGTPSAFIKAYMPNWGDISDSMVTELFSYFFDTLLPKYVNQNGNINGALAEFKDQLTEQAISLVWEKSNGGLKWYREEKEEGLSASKKTPKNERVVAMDWVDNTYADYNYFGDRIDPITKSAVTDLLSYGNAPLMLALGESAISTDDGEWFLGSIWNKVTGSKIKRFNNEGYVGAIAMAVMEQHGYGSQISDDMIDELNKIGSGRKFLNMIDDLDIADIEKSQMIKEVLSVYGLARIMKEATKDGVNLDQCTVEEDGIRFQENVYMKPDTARNSSAIGYYYKVTDDKGNTSFVKIGNSGDLFSKKAMQYKSKEIIDGIRSKYSMDYYTLDEARAEYNYMINALQNNATLKEYIGLYELMNNGYTLSYEYNGFDIIFRPSKKKEN